MYISSICLCIPMITVSIRYRLSKVAGEKLMDGNPNITDLSDVNRPTNLAEQFRELYDNEWTCAYEELQKTSGMKAEEEIVKKLGKILKVRIISFYREDIKILLYK